MEDALIVPNSGLAKDSQDDLGGEGAGGETLELASIDKSTLPLILELVDNNNFDVNLSLGKDKIDEVTKKVDSLLGE